MTNPYLLPLQPSSQRLPCPCAGQSSIQAQRVLLARILEAEGVAMQATPTAYYLWPTADQGSCQMPPTFPPTDAFVRHFAPPGPIRIAWGVLGKENSNT